MRVTGGRRGGVLAASGAALLLAGAVGTFAPALGLRPSATPAAPLAATPVPGGVAQPARLGDPQASATPVRRERGVSILQLGDSHTAADLFTGAVREILQAKFGAGGPGSIAAGLPHPGVRSSLFTASASPGWHYEGIQRSARPERFGLAGFTASTDRAGEILSLASAEPVPYTRLEIEAWTGPGAGSLVVAVDDGSLLQASLATPRAGRTVLELRAPAPGAALRRLVIRTEDAKPVTISGVGIFRAGRGVTYSSLGIPGATVEVLNRFPESTLADALARLAPDIVVLAFGTNEGFDAGLDPAAYRARYGAALREIRRAAPRARLVMIGPPQAERAPPGCGGPQPCPTEATASTATGEADGCPRRPRQLDQVRAVQRRLAEAERIPFWDWWALMPVGCGASRWAAADPPLMARDRVHFTRAGYRAGARAFAAFLEPEVRAVIGGDDAVSHD